MVQGYFSGLVDSLNLVEGEVEILISHRFMVFCVPLFALGHAEFLKIP